MQHLHPVKTPLVVLAVIVALAALMPLTEPLYRAFPLAGELVLFLFSFAILRFGAGLFFRLVLRGRVPPNKTELDTFAAAAAACGMRRSRLVVFDHRGDIGFAVGDLGAPTVLISTGLSRRLSPGALRALFSHEFGHVRLHHLDATAALLASFMAVKGVLGPGPFVAPVMLLLLFIYLAVRRSFEIAADRFAAEHSSEEDVSELLTQLEDGSEPSRWIGFLSTHPPLAERRQALKEPSR